jgi:hypothetical protein
MTSRTCGAPLHQRQGGGGASGRVTENGEGVEEVRTARLDGWIVWEHRNGEPD